MWPSEGLEVKVSTTRVAWLRVSWSLCLLLKKVSFSPNMYTKAGKTVSDEFFFELERTLGARLGSESQMKVRISKRFSSPF